MAIQQINIGQAPNDGTGDQLRSAFDKANVNFTELDARTSAAWTRANEGVAAATAAQTTADSASMNASVAQLTAEGAQATADEAQTTAARAGTAAAVAQVAADNVATAAGNAQTDASAALAQVMTRAPIANPVFTGLAAAPDIAISKAAGTDRRLIFQTAGVGRWGLEVDGAVESASNAGSSLVIRRYSDEGLSVDTPFLVDRATGRAVLGPGATGVDAEAVLFLTGGLRAEGWMIPGARTQVTLPTANAAIAGAMAYCADAVGGPSLVWCDGVAWFKSSDGLPVSLAPSGSSSTGRWSRFSDGTMIQRGYATATASNSSTSSSVVVFPQVFVGADYSLQITVSNTAGGRPMSCYSAGRTNAAQFGASFWDMANPNSIPFTASHQFEWLAVGRWKA